MRAPARLALLAASALAVAAASAVEEWAIDGGTTGLLVEDHRVPIVFLRIEFAAGSWSHWAETHDAAFAFESQLRDSAGELQRRADRIPADVEVSGGTRAASLGVCCRKEDLPAALDLVRAILANRDLDRAELRRRRKAADLAFRASLKEPRFVLARAAARLLFRPDVPRRRRFEKPKAPTTDPEKLGAARDVLVRLPGRVVGLAGDLTLGEARRLGEGLLPPASSDAPPDLAPRLGPVSTSESRPRIVSVGLPRLTQAYLAFGRESVGRLDPDRPASGIADHALGGHFNSRLMVALRQEAGDTYGAAVVDLGETDPGPYALVSFTKAENAGEMERKIREVLARFHEAGISEEERALAAGNVVGRRAFRRESPDDRLADAMTEKRHGLPYGFLDRQAEEAASLSLEDVNAFVRSFYDPERFTMITLRPE